MGVACPSIGPRLVAYAEIFATRRRLGGPGAMADLMIASGARPQGFSVVTRDVADFSDCGVAVVDPWAG
jgi:predicted nucleic acid-binding protein